MYEVVVNIEGQYSILPVSKTVPLGWSLVGVRGAKELCLTHINNVWVDMSPLSLRKQNELG